MLNLLTRRDTASVILILAILLGHFGPKLRITTYTALLSFAEQMYGSGRIAVNYATVYPLTMFIRVVAAQVLIMIMI